MNKKISLKSARIEAGLSQEDAAFMLGVSRDTISNWETGKSSPSTKRFKLIETAYKRSYDTINFLS